MVLSVRFLTIDWWHTTPNIWQIIRDIWQLTHNTCHATPDNKQVTDDKWLEDNYEFCCYLYWHVTGDPWHLLGDTWKVTPGMWHLYKAHNTWHWAPDIWHLTPIKCYKTPNYGLWFVLCFNYYKSTDPTIVSCHVSLVSVRCYMSSVMSTCPVSCVRCQVWPITRNLWHVRKGNSKNHRPTPWSGVMCHLVGVGCHMPGVKCPVCELYTTHNTWHWTPGMWNLTPIKGYKTPY